MAEGRWELIKETSPLLVVVTAAAAVPLQGEQG